VALAALDAGAGVIELGVPFSDPIADGPVIQRASEHALRQGTSLADVLELASEIRGLREHAGLIVFSYLNPVLRYGLGRFVSDAKRAGLDGALITDLTVEEAEEYRSLMSASGLATVFLIAPTSPDQRIRMISQASSGFIYAVSRTGVTGPLLSGSAQDEARQLVRRIRRYSKLPVAVGFGISTPEQFQLVGGFADAVVIGSAMVKLIGDSPGQEAEAAADWIESLKRNSALTKASVR
jgi:tryptophan synthase alpha chain